MTFAPDWTSVAAICVSMLALLISWRAHETGKSIRKQDLRIRARTTIDEVQARINQLPDELDNLEQQTLYALSRRGMTRSGVATREEEDREQMRTEVIRLCSEIEALDTSLEDKSDKELEAVLLDAQRYGSNATAIHEKINAKLISFEQSEKRQKEARREFHEKLNSRPR